MSAPHPLEKEAGSERVSEIAKPGTDATAPSGEARLLETLPRLKEAWTPSSKIVRFEDQPLMLDSGQQLPTFQVAYETWGELNADKSNAILVCHALTGDQYVVGKNPVTGKSGWWETLIGPGKAIDTDKYFIICANILGGCMGTTGPASVNPETGRPYGLTFPVITISDMVNAQVRLIDHLGIRQLFAVIGGSMGGMQVLDWAVRHKERVFAAMPIATAARHSSQ
ncbi:MAG: homoserine O-acetyltransferase family protein, partial [Hyphomicrobiaceae bacterium]